ncbi:hypothetical protein LTR97_004328 [Elasticomyces elasticus]|uniref:Transcription factor domain-containing protein n=1 Tax=Elasticomyces elasticus TaxID=574655 RepID=A0AAN8A277_9PEZI|nr:hypothetical protein LTR97_004328 [Elasticomyces elasticus]
MTAPLGRLTWVNYDNTSESLKDDENTSIIKSHAMRMVHETKKGARKTSQKQTAQTLWDERKLTARTPLVHHPGTDWEAVAVCQFLQAFVYPNCTSPVIAFQYLSFLPELYGTSFARTCLTEAIVAVATARLSNKTDRGTEASKLSLRARRAYTSALNLVNKSMGVPIERKSDAVLATLCLLAKYEMLTADMNQDLFQAHERGQVALVDERNQAEWLKSDTGVSLFQLVYVRHILNCVATSGEPRMDLGCEEGKLAFPAPCVLGLMRIIRRIAVLRCQAAADPLGDTKETTISYYIADNAVKLDSDMTALRENLPAELDYRSISNLQASRKPSKTLYVPPKTHIFTDLQHASYWHVFFCGRLHVLQTLLQYATYQTISSPEALHTRILSTVDDICASVPFALYEEECSLAFISTEDGGAVAGHYLTWLLAAASVVESISEPQRRWLLERLVYIGRVHGVQEALRRA